MLQMILGKEKIAATDRLEYDRYKSILRDTGFLHLALSIPDSDGTTMRSIVEQIGKVAVHDKNGTAMWDVRYDVSVDQEVGTRSLTNKEFPMHTDGSFEEPPPDYVALYCVQHDNLGGGETLFINSTDVFNRLSLEARKTLQTHPYRMRVPAEFFKGQDISEVIILREDGRFRFRHEIMLLDDEPLPAVQAANELETIINEKCTPRGINLKRGELIIFDNGRFFHGRTKIEDERRHLLRMWFHA